MKQTIILACACLLAVAVYAGWPGAFDDAYFAQVIASELSPGNDAYTKLLLHCDGADASTMWIDSSTSAMSVTNNGTAQIDTAVYKFGTGSGLFDGDSDYLTMGDSDNWDFGTGPFTIDVWHYSSGTANSKRYISCGGMLNPAAYEMWAFGRYVGSGSINFICWNGGGFDEWFASSLSFTNNAWIHSAVVRTGTKLYLFWNGTLVKDNTISDSYSINGGTKGVMVGARIEQSNGNVSELWPGQLDEIRVSKGIARWTNNFTPPSMSYGE